jgi:integrin beta 3
MLELADIADVIADAVKEATAPLLARIDALEKRDLVLPEKGEPGERGADGENGTPGADGRDGADGKDGIGLADVLRDADGGLVVVMTDGRTKSLGLIDGKDGKDGEAGKDGRDGLGFDDLHVEQVGERTVRFLLKRDADEAEFDVTFPVPIYRGVHKEGDTYEPGDLTTWAGSLWHCNEAKGLKPGAPDSGWQLAAKAGRPGKDAGK